MRKITKRRSIKFEIGFSVNSAKELFEVSERGSRGRRRRIEMALPWELWACGKGRWVGGWPCRVESGEASGAHNMRAARGKWPH